jgi:hypothetical protein
VKNRVITAVFVAALGLQLLDLHSTLTGLGKTNETNRAILFVSDLIGLNASVVLAKLLSVGALWLLFRAWTRSQGFDAVVLMTLLVICAVSGVVITNNYLRLS